MKHCLLDLEQCLHETPEITGSDVMTTKSSMANDALVRIKAKARAPILTVQPRKTSKPNMMNPFMSIILSMENSRCVVGNMYRHRHV